MANKLIFNERYIEILCDRNDEKTLSLITHIPYIHKNRINTKFRTTVRNIDLVLKLFRGLDVYNPDNNFMEFLEKGPKTIVQLLDKEMRRRIATKTLIELGPDGESDFLWRHQQLGRELSMVNDRFAFFYDTRTGKTPMSLQIIQDDIDRNPHHKWLVLCPLILIENAWLEDAHTMFPRLSVVNLHATTKAQRAVRFKQEANLYITNIESFVTYRKDIEKLGIHGCFVDESSAMKSNSSKFSKEAVDFAYGLKRWYLLSGTPAPNGEHEYYRQLQSIDYYGVHESYNQFKNYFFENMSYNPQYEKLRIREDKRNELLGLLRKYSLYVDKEDVLETPGRDFIEVTFELPEKLKDNYNELKSSLFTEIGNDIVVTAPSTVASLNKLNQVTSGFIIDTEAVKFNKMLREFRKQGPDKTHNELLENADFKQESYFLSDYRFQELDKILNKIGDKQAIIWCVYKKEFEILKQRLGNKCACVYGDTNIAEKNENIKAFKKGEVQYLVANPASADKGLTLTNAHYAIYFSLGYSYELWKQSIERIYGSIIKQPNRCTYYILIAKGTIDQVIYNTVKNKGDMSTAVLDHLKGGL